jgi:small conductance mechanosensitive channel
MHKWLFLLLWLFFSSTQTAVAQEGSAPNTAEQIDQVIATIEDEQKREMLLEQLRVLSEASRVSREPEVPPSPGADLMRSLSARTQAFGTALLQGLGTLASLPTAIATLGTRLGRSEESGVWLGAIFKIVLVFLCGLVAELVTKRLLRRPRNVLESTDPARFWSRIPLQFGRLVLDMLAIGAFGLAGYGVLSALDPGGATRLVVIALINATVLTRGIAALARFILSPRVSGLRLLPASDETANYWFVWVRRLNLVAVYGYVFVETGLLLGFPPTLHSVLLALLGLVILLMLIMLVQQNRRVVADAVAGVESATGAIAVLRGHLADFWNVFAIIYLAVVYGIWVSGVPGGFALVVRGSIMSLVVIGLATAVVMSVHRIIDRSFRLSDELRSRYPLLESRTNLFAPRLKTAASVVVVATAIISVLEIWGVDVLIWFESDVGRDVGTRAGTIVLVLVLALVIWEVLSVVIEHWISRPQEDSLRSARLETLLPLARKAALVVIVVVVTMTVLSELGVNIGPLLAGAGVVGLAVGFGAQTLVKDIITGAFILIEDSISIDDFVDVGGHEGTVESLSIRTICIRDTEGSVHTVPFSAVTSIINYTRDFGISKIEIGVAYREDIDHVIEVINELGEELLQDPEISKDILEPVVVQGVQRLDDSAVTIRLKIKTVPGMQWAMRREFFRRVKKRFDERGIEIPFPHRTIYFGVDQGGKAPPAHVQVETD